MKEWIFKNRFYLLMIGLSASQIILHWGEPLWQILIIVILPPLTGVFIAHFEDQKKSSLNQETYLRQIKLLLQSINNKLDK
jgi:hypothetical protein